MTKYEPLSHYLDREARPEVVLGFADVEAIIGTALPPSAFKYREWWANETNPLTAHVQCGAWLEAGYHAFADMTDRRVRFVRRPALPRAAMAQPWRRSSLPRGLLGGKMPATAATGPVLLAFAGLPGTGKTTIARQVAQDCGATYLRIDEIEQAIRAAQGIDGDVGPAGYIVAYALAESNLRLGRIVVADSVNPLTVTREAWRRAAASTGAPIIEIEIVCSDSAEHRRRIEGRISDIPGHTLPDWAVVTSRTYEPWAGPHMVIDTATVSAADAAARIAAESWRVGRLSAEAIRAGG